MEMINESIFPEKQIEYAGFWQRFGAAFLDGLILAIPNLVISYVAGKVSDDNQITKLIYGTIGQTVIGWLYSALQESGNARATLGKKALGISVVSVNGEKLTFGQASGRYFGKIISALTLLIGYLMMLWDSRSQTLHDKMAGALVIRD